MSGSRPIGGGGSLTPIADQRFLANFSGAPATPTAVEIIQGSNVTLTPGAGTLTIAASGTSLSSITSGFIFANFSGGAAAPQGVELVAGSGITFSGTTTSLTITASGATPGVVKLATLTASVVTASFDFTSIAAGYSDLVVQVSGRMATTSTTDTVLTRLNNDSGTNYNSQRQQGLATTNAATQTLGGTSFYFGDMTGGGGSANYEGCIEITFPNYVGTVFNKVARANGGLGISDASGNSNVQHAFGLWKSTATITQVTVFSGTGTGFVTGSTAILYARG